MRQLDLFSGIGGFALAASWVWPTSHEIVAFCEIDPFCRKVLKRHWPKAPVHEDVRFLNGNQFETVDMLTGGFPCQPYSEVGSRRGAEDDRALWPQMLRIIQESKPRWVVGENVDNFRNMGLQQSKADLEAIGYESFALGIPACAVGADHPRERVWIVAHSNGKRLQACGTCGIQGDLALAQWRKWCEKYLHQAPVFVGSFGRDASSSKPGIPRVNDGVPDRVDRNRALGNAIVPQVAMVIFQAIKAIESGGRIV